MVYFSALTGEELVSSIKSELEIIPLPQDASFIRWLGSLEQLCWSEIIRMKRAAYMLIEDGKILLDDLFVPEGEDEILATDVRSVYIDGVQAMHGSAEEGFLFALESAVWHVSGKTHITVDGAREGDEATVIYFARPERRNSLSARVALPDEFIELAASRLKGEAYRSANEDVLAAKWFADYNQKLEAFGAWCDKRRAGGFN